MTKRHPSGDRTMVAVPLCPVCDGEVPRTGRRGRPPTYCSDDCRIEANRKPVPPDPLDEARAIAEGWRDAYDDLLHDLEGVRLPASTRGLPWDATSPRQPSPRGR